MPCLTISQCVIEWLVTQNECFVYFSRRIPKKTDVHRIVQTGSYDECR
ncbi:MAG: hypothetical protein ACYS6W_01555 [Planctomycetota bacterium]